MKRWTKRRVSNLQATVENARMNTNHASSILLAIWQEWNPRKGTTQEERESLIDLLTDAKIQVECALEELEG